MKRTLQILLLSTIILSNCNKYSENNSELDFEKIVFEQIYPELISELKEDSRRMPPPPPMPYFDKNGNVIGFDSIGHIEALRKHKEEMVELDKDTSKIAIAIGDTIFKLEKNDMDFFKKFLKSKENVFYDSLQENKAGYKVNLMELKKDTILDFKYHSEFPEGSEIWYQNYPFHLNGIIGFSRIYFDKSKNYGMFKYSVTCGKLCGGVMMCFIKNENGQWEIEKEDLLVVF